MRYFILYFKHFKYFKILKSVFISMLMVYTKIK